MGPLYRSYDPAVPGQPAIPFSAIPRANLASHNRGTDVLYPIGNGFSQPYIIYDFRQTTTSPQAKVTEASQSVPARNGFL